MLRSAASAPSLMKILSQRSCSFSPADVHGLVRDLTWCCPWLGTGDAHTVMSVGTTLEMRCLQLLPDCLCNMLSITKHRNKNIGENLFKATALHQFLYLITSWSLPLGLWTSWSLLGYGPPISTGPSTSRQCTSSLTPGWHAGCGHWRHQATRYDYLQHASCFHHCHFHDSELSFIFADMYLKTIGYITGWTCHKKL